MASEYCLSLTKYLLFIFNLVFFFLGSGLLSLGLWILFSETSFTSLIPAPRFLTLTLFSYLMIIGGVVTILLGFFGSLGALKEVKCMLAIYFILLTVLLVAQTLGGVLLITQRTAFQNSLDEHVENLILELAGNNSHLQDFEQALAVLQHEVMCCGWTGPENWLNIHCSCYYPANVTTTFTNQTNSEEKCLPECSSATCDHYKKGCKEYIEQWLNEHILIILLVIFGLAVVESLQWACLVTFCCLNRSCRCCPLRKSRGSHVQLSRYVVRSFRCVCIGRLLWIIRYINKPQRLGEVHQPKEICNTQ